MKTVTPEEMRALERRSEEESISTDELMERAGLLAARVAWAMMGDDAYGSRVLVLVGSGNNGSDGLVAARHLQGWGARTTVLLLAPRTTDDPKLRPAVEVGVTVVETADSSHLNEIQSVLPEAALIVDAVLGTGRSRPLQGTFRDVLAATNAERQRRPAMLTLAMDVPSGVDAETGAADTDAFIADATVTFGYPKIGLFRFPGAANVGQITVADIGIPNHLAADIRQEVVTQGWAQAHLPSRPLGAHKGTFGRVLALVGSRNYVGAAYLACMGAARSGAGYVTLAATPTLQTLVAGKLTEPTYLLLPENPDGNPSTDAASAVREGLPACDVLLAGCGLGQHEDTKTVLEQLLLSGTPLGVPAVLDADALNALAGIPQWWRRLDTQTVITPHPGEMSRLLRTSIADVEGDRVATAQQAAAKWGVTVLLKGAFTVVASPDGDARIIPFANPALATAGTGDVLAGVIASLTAQGVAPYDAACLGAYLHAAAGEMVTGDIGNTGMIASDLLPVLPRAIKSVREGTFIGGIQEIAEPAASLF